MTEEREKVGYDTNDNQCEYCGCALHWPFNRILRHSQPRELIHKQGNIAICNDCIQSMHRRGELAIDAHTHKWTFTEDMTSQYKF